METQLFMGRGELVPRLIEQVGNRDFAMNLLIDRGDINPDGTFTAKGLQANSKTPGERAHERAGTTPHTHTYDSITNTVKKN